MHELPVTEQILEIVLEHAHKANVERVVQVNLVIGELTSFVADSLRFYFEILSKGTAAEKASLAITLVPAKAKCQRCGKEFHPGGMEWLCPSCGGPIEEVIGGREFYVESIEAE